MDVSMLSGALGSLKAMSEIVRSTVSLQISVEVRDKIIQMQNEILNVQAAMMELQGENMRLTEENRNLIIKLNDKDDWHSRSSIFELKRHPSGVSVYTSKENYGDSIAHACPSCFEDRKIYVLKLHQNYRGGETYQCTSCKNYYTLIPHGPEPVHIIPRSSVWG